MITRENYEEYFLSYVDDELTAPVRAAVETFVAENPDLRMELDALLQCRVTPDEDSGFGDKGVLLHDDEDLLSYVDGEMEGSARLALEERLLGSPHAVEQLRQLQMTVSSPDLSVVYPDKEELYRGRRRRVIFTPWLRAGVAAAVLGGAALLLLPGHHATEIADAPKKIQPVVTSPPSSTLHPIEKNEQAAVKKEQEVAAKEQGAVKEQAAVVKRTTVKDERQTSVKQGEHPIAVVQSDKQDVAVADPQVLVEKMTPVTAAAAVYIPKEQSSFATQALLQQEQEDSTDNSIADASVTPAKNKLRGLFRKVGRAFGKTADRDEDGQRQVLIGAFQVALK